MGTANSGGLPSWNVGAASGTPAPGGSTDMLQNWMNMNPNFRGGMGMGMFPGKMSKMGGAQDPNKWGLPSLKDVPQASSVPGAGFNTRMDPAAKQAMLAQMIARARSGGTPPAGTPPPPAGGI